MAFCLVRGGTERISKTPFLAAFNRHTRPPLTGSLLTKIYQKKKTESILCDKQRKTNDKNDIFYRHSRKSSGPLGCGPHGSGICCLSFLFSCENTSSPPRMNHAGVVRVLAVFALTYWHTGEQHLTICFPASSPNAK